jgi:NADH-quinone oxidoreductase subunit E
VTGAIDVTGLLSDPSFQKKLDALVASFPKPETALIPALHLCQSELRHVPTEFQAFIAQRLGMTPAHVRGVVTFYEMFSEKPHGKYLLQVCKTLPCMLAGSEVLLEHLQNKLGLRPGQTTQDGRFSLVTVECLACCDGGPSLMVNETLYRRVSPAEADRILAELE